MNDQVILVDENDNEIGLISKLEAHQKGLLHRAFSVFIFNRQGELLLQQRASEKYHSANLWSNTCCSHPLPGETEVRDWKYISLPLLSAEIKTKPEKYTAWLKHCLRKIIAHRMDETH